MRLYNTLTRKVEELKPLKSDTVTIYTCGPTVYDYAHIGHWFTYIRWDTLIRTLKTSGFNPKWVMNITDVGHLVSDADEGEDKLEKGARREGKTAWEVAKFYTDDFVEGMRALNMLMPDEMPRATDHIAEQIVLIQKLEEKGYTYKISDGIYYDTSKFSKYADFAKLDLEEQQAGARVEVNHEKRNQTDFALWKFSPIGQKRDMEWWSPWERPGQTSDEKHPPAQPRAAHLSAESAFSPSSATSRIDNTASEQRREEVDYVPKAPEQAELDSAKSGAVRGSWGFPGWHIECSAMSMKYLGETLDIHTGGIDHIPVHHSNEIAQSEAATDRPFANVWLHSNHVTVNGEKISKSLGNGIRWQDVADKGYDPSVLRLHILESHYRSQSRFSWESLESAKNRLKSYKRMADLQFQLVDTDVWFAADQSMVFIFRAMQDDLNSAEALAILSSLASQAEERLISRVEMDQFRASLYQLDRLFGLDLAKRQDITSEQKNLISEREKARNSKDWAKSDDLRRQLTEQGIGVRDTSQGSIWYRV